MIVVTAPDVARHDPPYEIDLGRRVSPVWERAERYGVLHEAMRTAGFDTPFDFLRCADCATVFLDPMPDPAGLAAFYDHYYVNRDYLAKADKKITRATKRIRRLFLGQGRFLDIGCNAGFAVEAARRAGLDATGIEIDAAAAEAAAQCFPDARILHQDAGAFAAGGERFDYLYCTEVIEHIPSLPRSSTRSHSLPHRAHACS